MIEERELKGIIQMLGATVKMVEQASLTGSLGKERKAGAGVRQYNAVVKRLQDTDTIPEGIFSSLEEEASFVELSIYCGQLAAYLEGMVEEPPKEKKSENIGDNVIVNIGGDLKDLGEVIRQAMPSWIKEQMGGEKEEEEKEEPEADMNNVESKIAELGAQMQVLAERMHREELSGDEIRKMADQMRELGQQQSELARQHAAVRVQINKTSE